MKPQTAFNIVVAHLRTQKGRAGYSHPTSSRFSCQYRDDRGRKCAIGALLPDSLYLPEMDRDLESISSLVARHKAVKAYFKGCPVSFLQTLQYIHDNEANWVGDKFVNFDGLNSVAVGLALDYRSVS